MKKISILLIIFIGVISCANTYRLLPKESASGTVIHNNIIFHVYEPSDFKKGEEYLVLTYLGTIEEYHLFRTWHMKNAISPNSDYASIFALKKEHCIIENERTLEEEENLRGFRDAVMKDGKFIVLAHDVNPNITDNN